MANVQSSKSKSESSSQAKDPAQTKFLKEALSIYGPELGKNENVFQGETIAPFSTLQQTAVSSAENIASSDFATTPQVAGTPLQAETQQTTKDLLAGDRGATALSQTDVSDFFDATVANPAKAALRDEVIPGIDQAFSGPGFFSAARSQGQAKAIQDTSDTLTQELAGLQFANLQRNQGIDEAKAGRAQTAVNQGLAVGQVPAQEIKNNLDIAASQLGNIATSFGIGQAEQTQEQATLEAEILKFADENAITDPENLAIIMALLDLNFSTSRSKGNSSSFGIGVG